MEPDSINIVTTASTTKSTTSTYTKTTTDASKGTTISTDVEKKLELLRSEHNEEIEKQNQVLDDVTKPTNLLGMN